MADSNRDTKIPVAETFYTLQGEGRSVGHPAVFLRTGGCNLLCGDVENPNDPQEELEQGEDATWTCDTIEVWKNPNTKTVREILEYWSDEGWLYKMEEQNAHLILTGGEPMLRQEELSDLLSELRNVTVEVETNGTIMPESSFGEQVDMFNVSQKLSNSGMDYDRRIKHEPTRFFRDSDKAMFKYVVSREKDLDEIWHLQDKFDIPNEDIQLMPAGYTKDDLDDTYQSVAEICMEHGYEFSQRLHVKLWGQATGV